MLETLYKNYGLFVTYKVVKPANNVKLPNKLIISYTAPNSPDPEKVRERGAFLPNLPKNILDICKKLKKGDEVLVHEGKNKNGYPELINITKPTEADKNPDNAYQKKHNENYSDSKPWGMIIQAALSSAIELLKINKTASDELKTDELIDKAMIVTKKIVTEKIKLENYFQNIGTEPKKQNENEYTEEPGPWGEKNNSNDDDDDDYVSVPEENDDDDPWA